ncbi:hypothetical protein BD410DRAFT_780093 [Rickenella mellea]|uniref:Cytochrome c oxidase subunit 8, mitochondrial n=1 Tax=Rickenella mellea TaxID=50990 RepID=A0A4R5XES0_9AGAM|nr:hypothetical protein BD410DRAFT_780093 [Rickenella mellea]
MMLLRARPPLLRNSANRITKTPLNRNVHIENHVNNNMPFKYHGKIFGVKVAAFMLGGFSIPFLASYLQLRKAAGSAA